MARREPAVERGGLPLERPASKDPRNDRPPPARGPVVVTPRRPLSRRTMGRFTRPWVGAPPTPPRSGIGRARAGSGQGARRWGAVDGKPALGARRPPSGKSTGMPEAVPESAAEGREGSSSGEASAEAVDEGSWPRSTTPDLRCTRSGRSRYLKLQLFRQYESQAKARPSAPPRGRETGSRPLCPAGGLLGSRP